MKIFEFIKDYWVLITFCFGVMSTFFVFCYAMIQATKCSLRNDILEIYDRCKDKKQITYYQLQSLLYSYQIYKMLRGNSFISSIVDRVKEYEIIE